jgi:hypothetical protein
VLHASTCHIICTNQVTSNAAVSFLVWVLYQTQIKFWSGLCPCFSLPLVKIVFPRKAYLPSPERPTNDQVGPGDIPFQRALIHLPGRSMRHPLPWPTVLAVRAQVTVDPVLPSRCGGQVTTSPFITHTVLGLGHMERGHQSKCLSMKCAGARHMNDNPADHNLFTQQAL